MSETAIYTPGDVQRIITPEICGGLWDIAAEIESTEGNLAELFEEQARLILRHSVGVVLLNQSCQFEYCDPIANESTDGFVRSMAFLRGGLCMVSAIDEYNPELVTTLNSQLAKRVRRAQRKDPDEICRKNYTVAHQNMSHTAVQISTDALKDLDIEDALHEIAEVIGLEGGAAAYLYAGAGWLVHETVTSQIRVESSQTRRHYRGRKII